MNNFSGDEEFTFICPSHLHSTPENVISGGEENVSLATPKKSSSPPMNFGGDEEIIFEAFDDKAEPIMPGVNSPDEEMIFFDKPEVTNASKQAIVSGSASASATGYATGSATASDVDEEIVFFSKPEETMLGPAKGNDYVDEEFIYFGLDEDRINSKPVIGSFSNNAASPYEETIIFEGDGEMAKTALAPVPSKDL